ncbi:hypothetical protein Ct61P_11265 [Colletotrichum tofieldiae]|nr:hypothetical protein Ct61P_11265 [Colletotrichum tofieldiae]
MFFNTRHGSNHINNTSSTASRSCESEPREPKARHTRVGGHKETDGFTLRPYTEHASKQKTLFVAGVLDNSCDA